MLILPEFLISGLRLFQSRVVEGKKDFLVISNRPLGKTFRSILKRVGNYYLIGEGSEGSAYFILFPTNLPQTIFVIGW
jgi:hypothetical protein